jgi:hypothetical protein
VQIGLLVAALASGSLVVTVARSVRSGAFA